MKKDIDFLIERNHLIDEIYLLQRKYEKFINKVSPQNWRTAGHNNTLLKEVAESTENFKLMTEEEANISWVKEALKD